MSLDEITLHEFLDLALLYSGTDSKWKRMRRLVDFSTVRDNIKLYFMCLEGTTDVKFDNDLIKAKGVKKFLRTHNPNRYHLANDRDEVVFTWSNIGTVLENDANELKWKRMLPDGYPIGNRLSLLTEYYSLLGALQVDATPVLIRTPHTYELSCRVQHEGEKRYANPASPFTYLFKENELDRLYQIVPLSKNNLLGLIMLNKATELQTKESSYEEIIRTLYTAKELFPFSAEIFSQIGDVHRKLGKDVSPIVTRNAYFAASTIKPMNYKENFFAAHYFMLDHDFDNAKDFFYKALEAIPDRSMLAAPTYYGLGLCMYHSGNLFAAFEAFSAAHRSNPNEKTPDKMIQHLQNKINSAHQGIDHIKAAMPDVLLWKHYIVQQNIIKDNNFHKFN